MRRKVHLSSLLPQCPRLLPSLWCGQHPSSHTGSIFHCSPLFLFSSSSASSFSLTPPHSPMVETINRAAFHGAVWQGYHSHKPSLFLSYPLSPSLSHAHSFSQYGCPQQAAQYSGGDCPPHLNVHSHRVTIFPDPRAW